MVQSTKDITAISLKTKILQTTVRIIRYVLFFFTNATIYVLWSTFIYIIAQLTGSYFFWMLTAIKLPRERKNMFLQTMAAPVV